jgi:hypothetical protein
MGKRRSKLPSDAPGVMPARKSDSSKTLTQFLIDYDRTRKATPEEQATYERLSQFFSPNLALRRQAARETIELLVRKEPLPNLSPADQYALALSWTASTTTLPRYATLDEVHVRELNAMVSKITDYYADGSRKRPLNFLMMAPPGSGKSHLIDCVSQALAEQRVAAHAFNMATMSAPEDLATPLDEARNLKVADKRPLLFLDEFDASPTNYGLLLPLLWDGKLGLRQRTITLGKAVVVMAGSNQLLPVALDEAQRMRGGGTSLEGPNAKLVDLISRINGAVVRIPPLDQGNGSSGRPFDKVAIAVELLKIRFPKIRRIPLALLAFVGRSRFRYDVRSITCLVDLITAPDANTISELRLEHMPKALASVKDIRESSLVYHLIDEDDNAHGVYNLWKGLVVSDAMVPVRPPEIPETDSETERRMFIDFAMSLIDQ